MRLIATVCCWLLLIGAAQAASLKPIVSPAPEGSRIFCTASCNLTSIYITTGAIAGYLLTFNQATVPADGAVQPQGCIVVPANESRSIDFGDPSDVYSVGLVAVFSTTGCFVKTVSNTAFFAARKVP
jgi:hypothetical protein